MIWQEILAFFIVLLFLIWQFCLLFRVRERMWLIIPNWTTDGRKFIVFAKTEQEADQIFMRVVCGWDKVFTDERSNAVITPLVANDHGVVVIE